MKRRCGPGGAALSCVRPLVRASARASIIVVAAMCLALGLAACGSAATSKPGLTPITVHLAWTHQAQFAGLYAADQNGYYEDEGLAVTFMEGGPAGGQVDSVLSDKAQFAITAADALLVARSQGKGVRAVAVDYRRSPRVYIALTESGITRPQDFVGKTIAVNRDAQPAFAALMQRVGVSSDTYDVVTSTPDLGPFYSGAVQVRLVYLTNEVLTARAAGYKINIIYPDDYGVHNYEDVLFASDKLIASDPDLVLRFVRATLKGWTYAVEHPAEVGAMVTKYKSGADVKLQNDQMAASLALINTGEDHIGWMKAETWAGMEKILVDGGAIAAPLDVTQAYTMKFLEQIYK
jgi:NitT/TauT family transport system substrate-binding protein